MSGTPQHIKEPNVAPDDKLIERIYECLQNLDMEIDSSNSPEPKIIYLCPAGRKIIEDFASRLQVYENKHSGILVSHIGKLRGITARLSLVLHYLNWSQTDINEPDVINAEYVNNAVKIVEEYFYPMAEHCLQMASVPQHEHDAYLVSQYIRKHKMKAINGRNISKDVLNRDTKRRDAALSCLEETGWIRTIPSKSKASNYDVNPIIHDI